MTERFTTTNLRNSDGEITKVVICDDKNSISNKKAVELLNEYEKQRVRRNKQIEEYRKREEKFQDIITGLMAFIELRVKEEIWSEWNE